MGIDVQNKVNNINYLKKPPWRYVFALGMLYISGACTGANNGGSVWDREARPDFAGTCAIKGHTVDNWGKAVCMERERMAWEDDPEQWRKDLTRTPSPPKIQVLPPEKTPYAGPQDF